MFDIHRQRINGIRKALAAQKADGIIITSLINIRYLTGYTGSSGLLWISKRQAVFFTDFRYQEQVKREVKGARSVIIKKGIWEELFLNSDFKKAKRIGFEKNDLKYHQYESLQKELKNKKLLPLAGLPEELRKIKDPDEIKKIARAAAIADRAFSRIVKIVKPGMTELEVSYKLESIMKTLGASGPSFDIIVGSGPNSALPHAQPSERKIRKGDFIVFDFGAVYRGYHSDMTRTVCVGQPSPRHLMVYNTVLKSQLAGLKALKAGIKGQEADGAARSVIDSAGYAKYFGHGLGHGVGLEVHEAPGVGSKSANLLPANSVVTVEPGVYLPGWGGVRIEDLAAVTAKGCRILSKSPKELIVIK
ncbi:aminopeptidase P family protein [candidate division TA06 bacterium]|uniref:Aminopeptidase P family protein n=1 Tax=candidate division TA06 bacterium TaxID=2250710 RepID=A0A933MIU3_UNCT6|nr:aminopeptidase P family protein [candidate division TA06 bacterium]